MRYTEGKFVKIDKLKKTMACIFQLNKMKTFEASIDCAHFYMQE